ncbi:DUF4169 family protein [Novispirillum sp. DQ9]|uniref:DUF4169 family protein n=1 Tax=Novispirillum sp. DQ9 TaxID=3398612 RepID=UPI003C7C4499
MGDVINLREARKRRDRATRESEAAANRSRFGRTKDQKRKEADAVERARRELDGKRLEKDPGEGENGENGEDGA